MANDSIAQARTLLQELIQAARAGTIIPIRLPGQLEALEQLLSEAEQESNVKQAPAPTGSAAEAIHENAEFMKTAIHELRTPMTSIRGYSDMIANTKMSGELNPMQSQLLEVIRTNSRRMEHLLSDMSYLNKIRAGILNVNTKMDMFKNIAMMAEKASRPLAEELHRELILEIPQGLPLLNTDGDLFAHAMYKLIENGLRYSAAETGKVVIRGRAEGSTLVATIEDNGIGMTPEEMAQLGKLYYRADHDLVRSYKGSGLGVAIAYGIIEALDGTHDVTSEPDKGTTFTLSLKGMV